MKTRDNRIFLRAFAIGVLSVTVVLSTALAAADEDPEPRVELELRPPEHIEEGDRFSLTARVRLMPNSRLPLLLTPSSEGTAIEVVRGRLLRADAEDPEAEPLVFRIPLVARSSGTAVLRVRVLAYVCEELCREIRAEESLTLRVHPK